MRRPGGGSVVAVVVAVCPTLPVQRGAEVAALPAARHRVDLFDLGARLPGVLADLRTASWPTPVRTGLEPAPLGPSRAAVGRRLDAPIHTLRALLGPEAPALAA